MGLVCYNARLANSVALLHVGRIAQSVEQRIENPRVAGSIPAPATNFTNSLKRMRKLGDFADSLASH